MLNKLKKSNRQGFTIIEVMIVLAIAGLIILIVLMAVPALQRNARNTALKSDAAAVAGGIAEFASNNDGAIPTAAGSACTTGSVSLNKASGTASTPKVQGSTGVTCGSAGGSVTPAAGTLTVRFGQKCPVTITGVSVALVASSRATAIVYANENSSATLQARCLDS